MRTLGIIGLCILAVIGGAIVFWPTYSYRYRITVEVEVDGTLKQGSSVIEVTKRWDPTPGRPISHYSTAAKGEAVFVDLGSARNLFLVLTNGKEILNNLLRGRLTSSLMSGEWLVL